MNGLDGFTDEDRKRARSLGLLQMGLALLGTQKGRELEGLSRAGLLGVAGYNQDLRDTAEERRLNAGTRRQEQIMAMQERQMAEQQRMAAGMEQARVGAITPAQPGMPEYGPPTMGGAMQPPVAPQPESFDVMKYAQGLTRIPGGNPIAGLELAQKFGKPQRKLKDVKTLMQNGQRVTVNLYDDGSHEILPYAPDAEKAHFANVGNAVMPVDPYTGKPVGGGLPMGQSPDSAASVGATIRGQNLAAQTAREGHANQAAAGQIVETQQGYARIGKDNTVTPIMAGEGQLQAKPTGAVQQQIVSNAVTLGKIAAAEQALTAYPDAFGLKNIAGDQAMQRIDPKGVRGRALVADIAGQKIHDRSGAAVTVGEAERLKPYVPNVNDHPDTIKKKLALFRKEYQAMQRELSGGASIVEVAGSGAGGWSAVEIK